MKTILSILTLLILSTFTFAQTTAIPDTNFEQALINLGLDSGLPNGFVLTANIDTLTFLDVSSISMADLTGIEDFIALTYLDCENNPLMSLDISNNTALASLVCENIGLTSLDVTNNSALKILSCRDNQLTSLDLTNNTALISLDCYQNMLTSLDLTQNTALTDVTCSLNDLTNLNVTNSSALKALFCANNQLINLDLTNNIALTNISCSNNQLTSLDLTSNTALLLFNCSNNQINCLNVKNGNNNNIFNFNTLNNPNLNCIEVDDITYSTTNWTSIDPQVSFSTSCNNDCSPVSIEENTLSQLSIYPNPTTGTINIDLEETESNINLNLINALGQVALTKNYGSTNLINLDIDAPTGIYFLQLEIADGKTQTLKVIKE